MAKATKDKSLPGYKELRDTVKEDRIERLYLLYGEESFLMERFLIVLGQALISPETAALDQITIQAGRAAGKLTLDRLRNEVMTPPFFSRRRLVIVRQSGWFSQARSSKKTGPETDRSTDRTAEDGIDDDFEDAPVSGSLPQAEQLTDLLSGLPDSTCLVFCESKVDRRLKNLMTAVQKAGVVGEFARERPDTLIRWIEGECRRRSLSIDQLAAESLIDRCDGQMQVIWNELSKIFLYTEGAGVSRISPSLIDDLSLPDLRGTIFDLTDAISAGQPDKALTLLDTLIVRKQPVQLVTFMLARHFRQLIVAKSAGTPDRVVAKLKVMPFVAQRLVGQARRLSPEDLEAKYQACFETDLAVKTGKITDRMALELLLVSAAGDVRQKGRSAGV